MKNILISSFDMEIGGVERSLISMLDNFDYENNKVDLMLYSHSGDFMTFLPKNPNLLPEIKEYKTFRLSIGDIIKKGKFLLLSLFSNVRNISFYFIFIRIFNRIFIIFFSFVI